MLFHPLHGIFHRNISLHFHPYMPQCKNMIIKWIKKNEEKSLNSRDRVQCECKKPLMITITNFGVPFKLYWFNFFHANESNRQILFLFKSPATQSNTVVYVFKERNVLLLFIEIGSVVLLLNYHT